MIIASIRANVKMDSVFVKTVLSVLNVRNFCVPIIVARIMNKEFAIRRTDVVCVKLVGVGTLVT